MDKNKTEQYMDNKYNQQVTPADELMGVGEPAVGYDTTMALQDRIVSIVKNIHDTKILGRYLETLTMSMPVTTSQKVIQKHPLPKTFSPEVMALTGVIPNACIGDDYKEVIADYLAEKYV